MKWNTCTAASNHKISILMLFLHVPSSAQTDLPSCTTEDTIVFCGRVKGGDMCVFSDMFKVTLTTVFQLSTSLNFHYGQLWLNTYRFIPCHCTKDWVHSFNLTRIAHNPCWITILPYLLLLIFELPVKKLSHWKFCTYLSFSTCGERKFFCRLLLFTIKYICYKQVLECNAFILIIFGTPRNYCYIITIIIIINIITVSHN